MLRVTPGQYSFLSRNAEGKTVLKTVLREPMALRGKKRVEDLPENQVEAQITDYLRHRGWICTKQHAGVFFRRGKNPGAFVIGEKGQADWRAERPIIPHGSRTTSTSCFDAELFYFEAKAPGQKPKPHQQLWLDRRQLTGITTAWFDSLEAFIGWYGRHYGHRAGDGPGR